MAGLAWRRIVRGAAASRFAGATVAGNAAARSRERPTRSVSRSRWNGRRSSALCTRQSRCSFPPSSMGGLSDMNCRSETRRMRAPFRRFGQYLDSAAGESMRFERLTLRIGSRPSPAEPRVRPRLRWPTSSGCSGAPSSVGIVSTRRSSRFRHLATKSASLGSCRGQRSNAWRATASRGGSSSSPLLAAYAKEKSSHFGARLSISRIGLFGSRCLLVPAQPARRSRVESASSI